MNRSCYCIRLEQSWMTMALSIFYFYNNRLPAFLVQSSARLYAMLAHSDRH